MELSFLTPRLSKTCKITSKMGGFTVLCFAGIYFMYKTDHEQKNLKIPPNSGKFLWELLYISPFPSYHA